ncbi:MAG: PEP-CTERM sorting domain-containing protein [Bryobacteraceae bacterium]
MFRTPYCLSAAALLVGLAVATPLASGSTITYTDESAWNSASMNLTTVGFEGLAPANSLNFYSTSAGLSIDGVQFVGVDGGGYQLTVDDSGFVSPYFNWGTGATLVGPAYASANVAPYIQVTLPAGVTSLGVNLMTVSPNATSFSVTLSDGTTQSVSTFARPTQAFFGATSDAPITSATFTLVGTIPSNTTQGLLDNFMFGAVNTGGGQQGQVPETDTLLLIGTGLAGLAWMKKRAA